MLELLLIDVALCAALIVVAACVMVRHRRRSSDHLPVPVREPHGAVAELAGEGMVQRETAVVPGFSDDSVKPDLGAHVPVQPEQAAQSQVSGVAGPEPGQHGPGVASDRQFAAVTDSERIGSYYDEADQPMAAYFAALGWAEEPGTHDPG